MKNEIINAVTESFIDKDIQNNSMYQYKILTNRQEPLLTTIIDLISKCDEFLISVAFVKEAATKPLIIPLNEALRNGVKGKIVVGNKQFFSDPNAILFFDNFTNIETRLNTNHKLHTKGYFFRKDKLWTMIIGSSNLTMSALKTNEEWNMIFNSIDNGRVVSDALAAFYEIWNESLPISDSINEYTNNYNHINKMKSDFYKLQLINTKITPNSMQREALESLNKIRLDKDKALIISATGTGKTFLSAFDVQAFNPKRMLFIVHRENIAQKALETFKKLMPNKSMGLYTGTNKHNSDYLFCTVQTFNKEKHLSSFNKYDFDYIIIDEVHHSGATTYQRILDYFKPSFLLGLTATPERTDGYNIYELFDYNVAYEIRLNDAIENNLIVPFHYFGVSEVCIDGEVINELSKVSMREKALNIKDKSVKYGYNGNKVKGLIFIDKVENAISLAKELNDIGYKAVALTSSDNDTTRNIMIDRLNMDVGNYLDFIITVDIFNEGIDIPCVNQVILLRPTESVIVYIQQLGRGLRKSVNKEYLVVLDFIGNYKRNFLVPVALSGDSSFDVDSLNQFVEVGSKHIAGKCTINFEPIAKKLILDKIDKKQFKQKNLIQADYEILKQRLNRTPYLNDFFINNMLSPEHILSYKSTYYEVVKSIDKEYKTELDNNEILFLKYLSQEFTPAKRVHELLIVKCLLEDDYTIFQINKMIEDYLQIGNQMSNTQNAFKHLTKEIFAKDNTRIKFDPLISNGRLCDKFTKAYNNTTFKEYVDDVIEYNLGYVNKFYKQVNESTMILHKSYSRKEAFHMMNLEYNAGYQVGGYKRTSDTNKVLVFIKSDKSSYSSEILDERHVVWYSQNNRAIPKSVLETQIANNEVEVHMFIRKEEGEKEFYMGSGKTIEASCDGVNIRKMIKYKSELKYSINIVLLNYLK